MGGFEIPIGASEIPNIVTNETGLFEVRKTLKQLSLSGEAVGVGISGPGFACAME